MRGKLGGMTDLTESVTRPRRPAGRADQPGGRAARPGRVAGRRARDRADRPADGRASTSTSSTSRCPPCTPRCGASGAGLQLIVAGYTIAYAVLLITGARLGDILGHRRMYLAGIGAVHPGLARLRARPVDRRADRAAVPPGGRRGGDDPAGAQPHPAQLHRARAAGAGDEPVRDRHLRRRRARPGDRRAAGQREPVRQLLAAGLPGQRAGRAGRAGLRAAAARRAGSTGCARSTCPAWRCSPRPCSRSCCRWCSGSRSAGRPGAGPCWRPRWLLFALLGSVEQPGRRRAAGSRSCPARCSGCPA